MAYKPSSPTVLVTFALFYIVAVVLGVVALVMWGMTRIEMVMLIPLLLSLLMCVWLCLLAWPLRYRFNTISAACASQNKNFLRIILVLLTCMLSTALSAALADEYEQHRNPRYNAFVISELVFSLLIPLTGLFPTVEVPRDPFTPSAWGVVNLGTMEHPVNVPGLYSFAIHFVGVIPFMFGMPVINCVYALQSRHQTWVLFLAFGAVALLLGFIILQVLIHLQHSAGMLAHVPSDTLFVFSFAFELGLVISVSLGTFLFSLKRNQSLHVNWDLDGMVHGVLLKGKHLM
jgi:hypothetical protein